MKPLKFNKDGKFRILQISDLQDTKATSVDTLKFVEAALEEIKPDLLVFTGDQLDVVGLWGKGEKAEKNVRDAILNLFAPIRKSGIPFLVTFGNHDCQTGVPNSVQAEYYSEIENCICFDDTDDGRPDVGTYNQVIMNSDGTKPALNIYMVDSNSANPDSPAGYDTVHPDQIEWCTRMSSMLRKANGSQPIPSIVFQHIPPFETYKLLSEVPSGTPDSLPAYRAFAGKRYIRDESKIWQMGTFGETPAVPDENSGQFDALKEQGDVFAIYFGHDHYNSFVGKVDGIDVGYCPGAGYNTYGLNPRGMRVFDFDEKDVTKYETRVIRVTDFYNEPLYQPVKNFVYINAPSSIDAAKPFALKCVIGIAIVVAVFILLGKLTSGAVVGAIWIIIAVVAAAYGIFSFVRNSSQRKKILSKYGR